MSETGQQAEGSHYHFQVSEEALEELDLSTEGTVRLDKFLAFTLSDQISRERLQQLIKTGAVMVNGAIRQKTAFAIGLGDRLSLLLPAAEPLALPAEDIPLEIVYEDAELLVVNKPVGMLTHPTGRETRGTLVNALLHHCAGQLSGINGILRPGIVHRLDRETGGLLVVAKTDRAHRSLAAQIKAKTARREYLAIAQGHFPQDSGVVDAPIGRNPTHRNKMCIDPAGRAAVTRWTVQERLHGRFTLLRLQLETGRTHQIRVHLAHIRHPILGDPLYGSGVEKALGIRTHGQLLQAVRLGFAHPVSGEAVVFEIPMEAEMQAILEQLRAG
jgi:23S rRNA pseudouridine1911/1915/1917 synthase